MNEAVVELVLAVLREERWSRFTTDEALARSLVAVVTTAPEPVLSNARTATATSQPKPEGAEAVPVMTCRAGAGEGDG